MANQTTVLLGTSSMEVGCLVSSEHFVRGIIFFLANANLYTYICLCLQNNLFNSVCILFGLWNCLSILLAQVMCLVSGIIQVCVGFIVLAIEAPFCCMFIDHVQVLSSKVEERPLWNRAAVYCM